MGTVDTKQLTSLQKTILTFYAQGKTFPEIADELHYTTANIFRVVKDAKYRLGARNIGHALAIAIGNGEIEPYYLADEIEMGEME